MQSKELAVGSTAKTIFGMLEYLATHRPLTHICENVDDIVAEGSSNLYNMEVMLFERGYVMDHRVLCSSDFGAHHRIQGTEAYATQNLRITRS